MYRSVITDQRVINRTLELGNPYKINAMQWIELARKLASSALPDAATSDRVTVAEVSPNPKLDQMICYSQAYRRFSELTEPFTKISVCIELANLHVSGYEGTEADTDKAMEFLLMAENIARNDRAIAENIARNVRAIAENSTLLAKVKVLKALNLHAQDKMLETLQFIAQNPESPRVKRKQRDLAKYWNELGIKFMTDAADVEFPAATGTADDGASVASSSDGSEAQMDPELEQKVLYTAANQCFRQAIQLKNHLDDTVPARWHTKLGESYYHLGNNTGAESVFLDAKQKGHEKASEWLFRMCVNGQLQDQTQGLATQLIKNDEAFNAEDEAELYAQCIKYKAILLEAIKAEIGGWLAQEGHASEDQKKVIRRLFRNESQLVQIMSAHRNTLSKRKGVPTHTFCRFSDLKNALASKFDMHDEFVILPNSSGDDLTDALQATSPQVAALDQIASDDGSSARAATVLATPEVSQKDQMLTLLRTVIDNQETQAKRLDKLEQAKAEAEQRRAQKKAKKPKSSGSSSKHKRRKRTEQQPDTPTRVVDTPAAASAAATPGSEAVAASGTPTTPVIESNVGGPRSFFGGSGSPSPAVDAASHTADSGNVYLELTNVTGEDDGAGVDAEHRSPSPVDSSASL